MKIDHTKTIHIYGIFILPTQNSLETVRFETRQILNASAFHSVINGNPYRFCFTNIKLGNLNPLKTPEVVTAPLVTKIRFIYRRQKPINITLPRCVPKYEHK